MVRTIWKNLAVGASALLFAVSVSAALPQVRAAAYDPFSNCGSDCQKQLNDTSLQQGSSNSKVKNLINTALLVLGIISVIMVVVGGLRITLSRGEAANVKAGRETILYAVVGLVVALSAYAIVNFVIHQL